MSRAPMILDSCVTSDGTVAMIGEAPIASVALAESEAKRSGVRAKHAWWHIQLNLRTIRYDNVCKLLNRPQSQR